MRLPARNLQSLYTHDRGIQPGCVPSFSFIVIVNGDPHVYSAV